ncbi:MAG: DUF1648 domain-containing protein [Nevskia sp.]|nr:DUF1648 domain-containing protein [Nevskia sp.]
MSKPVRRADQRGVATLVFLVVLACAAAFIWQSSQGLPARVASHFVGSGTANGFMPRDRYVQFMLGFAVGLPLVLVFLSSAAFNSPGARLNLPNREYWLAPERRAATIAVLRRHMATAGTMLVVFLAYVHWMVVRANAIDPPHLPEPWFMDGLALFVLAMLAWGIALVLRFSKVPR